VAASVQHRLLLFAQRTKEEHQLVLIRYGIERLLFRLSQSPHAGEFVVKGAMMFLVWKGEAYRATKDLDLLALQTATTERLENVFRELCRVAVEEDGLEFLSASVRAEDIRAEAHYQGVRVRLEARLGKARIPLQVDIGFGDAVTPKPATADFPPLLEFPAPRLTMYRRETSIAEKFEAMVNLGILNSRMKDFYDLWVMGREFEFDGAELGAAIAATFSRRKTALPHGTPFALTEQFGADPTKREQWRAFVQRGRLKLVEPELRVVIQEVRDFLMPVVTATVAGGKLNRHWPKSGPWQPEK
jgi:hypothetical protein